jgi:hypothetical protein
MNPWLLPWLGLYRWPLSGDVTQDIAPVTRWLSPQLEVNFAGDTKIEAEVVADVASYGKQLGIVSEAVLEIADGKQGAAVERLRSLVADVDEIKRRHAENLEKRARADLAKLKETDPSALERLLGEFREP